MNNQQSKIELNRKSEIELNRNCLKCMIEGKWVGTDKDKNNCAEALVFLQGAFYGAIDSSSDSRTTELLEELNFLQSIIFIKETELDKKRISQIRN